MLWLWCCGEHVNCEQKSSYWCLESVLPPGVNYPHVTFLFKIYVLSFPLSWTCTRIHTLSMYPQTLSETVMCYATGIDQLVTQSVRELCLLYFVERWSSMHIFTVNFTGCVVCSCRCSTLFLYVLIQSPLCYSMVEGSKINSFLFVRTVSKCCWSCQAY